ncbi:MAG: 50S ribosomal protein L6 [Oscillospiraceae bacterium]|nr:50S ribosomal protein L6 [Oscillospiraceae bacterium]
MSRIGRKPIAIPAGVDVTVGGDNLVTVKGSKGTLSQSIHENMEIAIDGSIIMVHRPDDSRLNRSLHGLSRTLIANMVEGVSQGFKKELDIVGVGYRAQKQGNSLVMNLGYSHQVIMPEIEGITIEVPAPGKVVVNGSDKQKVGQFAAEIRKKRPPEPYKGKGVRYTGEHVRKKEGKAGKGKK